MTGERGLQFVVDPLCRMIRFKQVIFYIVASRLRTLMILEKSAKRV